MKDANFPNVVGSTWSAIFAPAGLPPALLARLNTSINAFLSKDDTRKQFGTVGYRALGGPPERLRQQMIEDRAKWSKVVKSANVGGDQ
jgi:tripartite-type tricarboxylate transporter receptor subunit TctC